MQKIFFLFVVMQVNIIYACEPASVDWEDIYHQMDLTISNFGENEPIHYENFKKVTHFTPYDWPQDKKYNGNDGKLNLFNALDKNQDQKISEDELFNIYLLLPNPCAGWPWS